MGNGTVSSRDAISTAKSVLRTQIRHCRAALIGGSEREHRDSVLGAHLLRELDHRDPHRETSVAAYCPQPGEPGGLDLPDRIAATGRLVWVPIVTSPGQPLRWHRWRGLSNARPAAFGILEPIPTPNDISLSTAELLPQVAALIVPALAIGPCGERLGQGGGFYDRSLADSAATSEYRGKLLAIVDHNECGIPVPTTELDITVPVVITDTGIFHPTPQETP